MDIKLLKQTMASEIKKGNLVAITGCCKAPMSVKAFKAAICDLCGAKQQDNSIFFYDSEKYKELAKKTGN